MVRRTDGGLQWVTKEHKDTRWKHYTTTADAGFLDLFWTHINLHFRGGGIVVCISESCSSKERKKKEKVLIIY